jgi:hypothetical protein
LGINWEKDGPTDLPGQKLLENEDFAGRIDLFAGLYGRVEQIPCGQPRIDIVIQLAEELLASELGRFRELCLHSPRP